MLANGLYKDICHSFVAFVILILALDFAILVLFFYVVVNSFEIPLGVNYHLQLEQMKQGWVELCLKREILELIYLIFHFRRHITSRSLSRLNILHFF